MQTMLETLAAPYFAFIDFALASPAAAIATASVAGIAIAFLVA